MKTKKEIKKQKREDLQFIISAVTTELYEMARLEYFETWENEGGMGWFFDECVALSKEVMFREGSEYMKWLDYWSKTDDEYPMGFLEYTDTTCFDWYHMEKARELFKSKYVKDENPNTEIIEHIERLLKFVKK